MIKIRNKVTVCYIAAFVSFVAIKNTVAQDMSAAFAALKNNEIAELSSESEKSKMEKATELLQVNKEYGEEIYNLGTKIKDDSEEMAELTGVSGSKKTSEETAQETQELMGDDGPMSIEEKVSKKKKKLRAFKDKLAENIKNKTKKIIKSATTKKKQEVQSGASETVNGTSESAQVVVESIGEQLDLLYDYLDGELLNLQSETYALLYAAGGKKPDAKESSVIDLCQYSRTGCSSAGGGIGGLIGSAKKKVSSANQKVVKGVSAQSITSDVAAIDDVTKSTDFGGMI